MSHWKRQLTYSRILESCFVTQFDSGFFDTVKRWKILQLKKKNFKISFNGHALCHMVSWRLTYCRILVESCFVTQFEKWSIWVIYWRGFLQSRKTRQNPIQTEIEFRATSLEPNRNRHSVLSYAEYCSWSCLSFVEFEILSFAHSARSNHRIRNFAQGRAESFSDDLNLPG